MIGERERAAADAGADQKKDFGFVVFLKETRQLDRHLHLRGGLSSLLLIGISVVLFCANGCRNPSTNERTRIVNRIDHILVASTEAEHLFSTLTDTFKLPVAWPFSDYGGFASGGVALGNLNVEVLQRSGRDQSPRKSRWAGFAVEPEPLGLSLPALDARGVARGEASPFRQRQKNGLFKTRWTTVGLPGLSAAEEQVFLCRFEDDIPTLRQGLLEQLESVNGGPLSLLSVKEIVMGAQDLPLMQSRWQELLDPALPDSDGLWILGGGPALRLVKSDRDGIQGLVILVKSLKQARACLQEMGLTADGEKDECKLCGSLFDGLEITFVKEDS